MDVIYLTELHCWCGLPIHTSKNHLEAHKRSSTVDIYCPVGHTPSWRTSTAEQETRKAKAEATALRAKLDQTKARLEHEKRSHAATKGTLTKTRKRISNGVCPCCNRTFSNLADHMRSKHPEYAGLPTEGSS